MKKILNKIFFENRPMLKLVVFAFADAVSVSLAVILAFLLRFEGNIPFQHFFNIEGMVLFSLLIFLPLFYFFKMYYFAWNYVSTDDLISIIKFTTFGFLILTALIFIFRDTAIFTGFPRSTIFISYFLMLSFVGGSRVAKRVYLQMFAHGFGREKERTLIVGAGDAGEQMLRSILNAKDSPFLPIAFVDDSPAKQRIVIHGLAVLGKIQDVSKIVKDKNIQGIIIALPSAGSETIRAAVAEGRKAGVKKIKIVPAIGELMDGRVGLEVLREVPMEDLLGREPLKLDQKPIENFIQGKRVLVTGAAGSIGSELCRQVVKFHPEALFLLDQDETGLFNISNELKIKFPNIASFVADVRDEKRIENIFKIAAPKIVLHAAAYKHVPLMEENFAEAVNNNIIGTETITRACIREEVEKFVFISTDKAVNPTSIMGASKRIGEMICQAANQEGKTKFISVRFGNVADSRGSVIPIFKEKIQKREAIEITHSEMKRYFMTIPEACLLVLQASAMGQGGEVFVLDMGDPIKIMDLAKELIKLSGLEPDKDIPIVFSEPRAGEKFFEEILTAEEGTTATQNQKIFMARLSQVESVVLKMHLEELKKAAAEGNKDDFKKIVKEIVPSFHPANFELE